MIVSGSVSAFQLSQWIPGSSHYLRNQGPSLGLWLGRRRLSSFQGGLWLIQVVTLRRGHDMTERILMRPWLRLAAVAEEVVNC